MHFGLQYREAAVAVAVAVAAAAATTLTKMHIVVVLTSPLHVLPRLFQKM